MNLPEKLRNIGIQPAPKEKVKVNLSDSQIHALSDVVLPVSSEKGA